jgi:hypothetical protein
MDPGLQRILDSHDAKIATVPVQDFVPLLAY